jgi:uncharacterized protein (DUF697 family)
VSTVESIVPESTVTESQSINGVSDENTASAERIIQDHVLLAVASGLVPGPGLDLVAAFTVQLTMLKRLATLYDVPFRQDAAKSTVTALFGTLGGAGAAAIAGASFLKFIPVVGTAVGIAGTSVAFGAFTYAIGKVFLRHFESGGTFIDLNPRAYREYFREMNVRGRTVAAEKQDEAKTAGKVRPRRTAAPAAAEA